MLWAGLWERACPRKGQKPSHKQLSFSKFEKPARFIVGAGGPAKQATRCLAPAAPVFAGTPAPTGGTVNDSF